MFRYQKHGKTLVFPLEFRESEDKAMEKLLMEFLSVSYLIEDIPADLDTMDTAREALRRFQSWLEVQDSGKTGFATPFQRQLHPSMHRITELFVQGTKTPWGLEKEGGMYRYVIKNNIKILFSRLFYLPRMD